QTILSLGRGGRGRGGLADFQRHAELTTGLQVAPVNPEVLVDERQRQKSATLDSQRLAFGIAEQVNLTPAATAKNVIRQSFDAGAERSDQIDEPPPHQHG